MADESQITSAINSSVGRLLSRTAKLTPFRPEAPRGFTVVFPSMFSWVPPAKKNFTHYRIRIDHDDGEADIELSSGNLRIQLFYGTKFFLSTYNQTNGLESPQVTIEYDAVSDLGTGSGGGGGGGGSSSEDPLIVTADYTLTSSPYPIPCTPSPQSGTRLTIFLTQDATGGRTVSWASCYKNGPTALDGTPNTVSVVSFVYRSSYWYYDGSFETALPFV